MFRFNDYKLINENLEQARKILKDNNIDEENSIFKNIRKMLSNNLGYIGLFTKFAIVDKVDENTLEDLYKKLIELKPILNKLPKQPTQYIKDEKGFEELYDDLQKIEEQQTIKKIINEFPSKQKQLLKNIDNINDYLIQLSKAKDKKDFISKVSRYHNEDDLFNAIKTFIDSGGIGFDLLVDEMENDDGISILKKDDNRQVLLVEIKKFNSCNTFFSNTSWCIASSEGFFKSYTSDSKKQYAVINFDLPIDDPYRYVGFTINVVFSSIHTAHLKNDKFIDNKTLIKYLESIDINIDNLYPSFDFIVKNYFKNLKVKDQLIILSNYNKKELFDKKYQEYIKIINNLREKNLNYAADSTIKDILGYVKDKYYFYKIFDLLKDNDKKRFLGIYNYLKTDDLQKEYIDRYDEYIILSKVKSWNQTDGSSIIKNYKKIDTYVNSGYYDKILNKIEETGNIRNLSIYFYKLINDINKDKIKDLFDYIDKMHMYKYGLYTSEIKKVIVNLARGVAKINRDYSPRDSKLSYNSIKYFVKLIRNHDFFNRLTNSDYVEISDKLYLSTKKDYLELNDILLNDIKLTPSQFLKLRSYGLTEKDMDNYIKTFINKNNKIIDIINGYLNTNSVYLQSIFTEKLNNNKIFDKIDLNNLFDKMIIYKSFLLPNSDISRSNNREHNECILNLYRILHEKGLSSKYMITKIKESKNKFYLDKGGKMLYTWYNDKRIKLLIKEISNFDNKNESLITKFNKFNLVI